MFVLFSQGSRMADLSHCLMLLGPINGGKHVCNPSIAASHSETIQYCHECGYKKVNGIVVNGGQTVSDVKQSVDVKFILESLGVDTVKVAEDKMYDTYYTGKMTKDEFKTALSAAAQTAVQINSQIARDYLVYDTYCTGKMTKDEFKAAWSTTAQTAMIQTKSQIARDYLMIAMKNWSYDHKQLMLERFFDLVEHQSQDVTIDQVNELIRNELETIRAKLAIPKCLVLPLD
jgi:hypothetical protein